MLAVLLLSLTTAMSISISAFATYNGGSTGNNGGGEADKPGFSLGDQGYRLALVDANTGETIGGNVIDLVPGGYNDGSSKNYGSVGTDTGSSASNKVDQSGFPEGAPPPIGWVWDDYSANKGHFYGNGDAVKDWMLQDTGNGQLNIDRLVQENFDISPELQAKIDSGEIKMSLEGIYNLPVYNDSGYLGYRVTGTIRDFIEQELRDPSNGSTGGWMGPVVRAALESLILENDDVGHLNAMSPEEIEALIHDIIKNRNLDELGLGMHIFSRETDGTPPPPTPPSGKEDIHITESRITRRKNLTNSELDSGETLGAHAFKWEIEAFSTAIQTCSGCHHSSKEITDKTNVINVEQSIDNQEAQGVIKPWSYMTEGGSYTPNKFVKTWSARTVGEDKYQFSGAGYCIVVIRKDDTIDLIDYRQYGNEGTIDGISSIVVNTDSRASRGRYANGSGYAFDVNLHYEPNEGKWGYDKKTVYTHTDKTNTTPSPTEANPNPSHTHSSNPRTETKETKFNTGTAVDMKVHVTWDVYGGIPNGGTMDTTSAGLTQHLNGSHMETWLEIPMAGGTTSFHPYVKMMYDTNLAEKLPVYVAAQYERKIAPNEYVGVIFDLSANTGNKVVNSVGSNNNLIGKLALSSNQWSTHVTANNKVGNSDCVLPGGATLDLAILAAQRQTFTVEGLAPLIGVSGQKQVNASGGTSGLPTQYEGQVQDNYIDYAKQVVEALETLNVQQYVSQATSDTSKLQNITQAVWDMTGARAVSPQANSEEKYYFRPDKDDDPNTKEDANMGDLDVQIGSLSSYTDITQALKSETAVTYYTFFTNTQGELRVKVGSSLAASSTISGETDGQLVLSKGQTAANITDTKIKKINDKTHIVTKLVAALETNTGGDSDATWVGDGAWYNEAFDGITIVQSKTTLKLGFIKPFSRVSVIDPKLCPSSASKSDILNSYVFSQIKMRNYCEKYGSSAVGKLATYKGNEVKTQHLDELFKSDIFYIPNATVQDLR